MTPNEAPTPILEPKYITDHPLRDTIRELVTNLHEPAWTRSEEAQAGTLSTLAGMRDGLGEQVFDYIVQTIHGRLGGVHSPDRLVAMVGMSDLGDIMGALRYRPTPPLRDEEPGADLYPTEGFLNTYLNWTQDNMVPIGFHFWCGVAALGAACRRNISYPWVGGGLFPTFSFILVGESGTGKSTALNVIRDLFGYVNERMAESEIHRDNRIRVLPHSVGPERLIELMKTTTDTEHTPHRTGARVHRDATGLFMCDELGTLLGRQAFNSSKMVVYLNALLECPRYFDASTIGRGDDRLYNIALTFTGGTTPGWIRKEMTTAMLQEGFIARVPFIHRDPCYTKIARYPEPLPSDPIIRDYLVGRLYEFATMNRRVARLHPAAKIWYDECHEYTLTPQMKDLRDMRLVGYYKRKGQHLIRLAFILSLSDGSFPTIEVQHLSQALHILDDEEVRMPRCFSLIGEHPEAEIIEKVLIKLKDQGGVCSHTDLMRACRFICGSVANFRRFIHDAVEMELVNSYHDKIRHRHPLMYRLTQRGEDQIRHRIVEATS